MRDATRSEQSRNWLPSSVRRVPASRQTWAASLSRATIWATVTSPAIRDAGRF